MFIYFNLDIYIFIFTESEKFSQEPSFKMTVGRMLDLTYRLNVGILSLSMNKMKDLGDPTTWVSKTDNRIFNYF